MNVALRFVRPELDGIRVFVQAALAIKLKAAYCNFTLIVPHHMIPTLSRELRDIGVVSLQDVKDKKMQFTKVVECSAKLSGIDTSKAFDVAHDHIVECIGLHASNNTYYNTGVVDNIRRIVIEGVLDPCDGYGASAENLVLALTPRVPTTFIPRWHGQSAHLAHPLMHQAMAQTKLALRYLYYLAPTHDTLQDGIQKPPESKRFLLTMFESNRVPLAWPSRINGQYDRVLVPCTFNKDVFEKGGITVPISILKLGVRTDVYQYTGRTIHSSRPYRFLFLFANHALNDDRKNGVMVLEAFTRLFANRSDVELIVKVSGHVPKELHRFFVGNVKLINERSSIDKIAQLYNACDCFLFPSKGEGYGMPPREAMATGMPAIIVDFSATSDIANPDITIPIKPHKLVPAVYSSFEANRHNNGHKYFGEWASIQIEQLMDKMEWVYFNQHKALEIGKRAAVYIQQNETTAHTAQKLIEYFDGKT